MTQEERDWRIAREKEGWKEAGWWSFWLLLLLPWICGKPHKQHQQAQIVTPAGPDGCGCIIAVLLLFVLLGLYLAS